MIRILVQDDGPGIPKHKLSRIFDPFFTSCSDNRGTGLGLPICHGIVKEHGGHIWAESTPGNGVTFYIELPVVPVSEDRAPSTAPTLTTGSSAAGHILLIDDDLAVQKVISRALERKGYHVDAIDNGKDALDKLRRSDLLPNIVYDLIICDLRMPEMSGLEFYELAL